MQRQWGPLKVWQWGAAIGVALVAYWLYRKYKTNAAASASNTGTDTSGYLTTPTQGQDYASTGGYGYGYDSLQSQLTAALYDPATGQNYFAELLSGMQGVISGQTTTANALAGLATADQNVAQQLQTLAASNGTKTTTTTVAQPDNSGNNTTTGGGPASSDGGANNTTTVVSQPPISSFGTPVSGGTVANPVVQPNTVIPSTGTTVFTTTGAVNILSGLPISKQIQLVQSGQYPSTALGPNALKIYNAGGISTALPTKAAVDASRNTSIAGYA